MVLKRHGYPTDQSIVDRCTVLFVVVLGFAVLECLGMMGILNKSFAPDYYHQIDETKCFFCNRPFILKMKSSTPNGTTTINTATTSSSSPPPPSRIVWQTWATTNLPPVVEQQWSETRMMNSDYEFRRMDDEGIEQFIKDEFDETVSAAFMSLNPDLGAMRADFWRYCVLYKYGGVYSDLDSNIAVPLKEWVNQDALISFERNPWDHFMAPCSKVWRHVDLRFPEMTIVAPNRQRYLFVQWFLVFPTPGHPILAEMIRLMTELITRWKDTPETNRWSTKERVVCLTGPVAFSVAIMNSWEASGRNWTRLQAQIHGVDYERKAVFKVFNQARDMNATRKGYSDFVAAPIKREFLPGMINL